MDVMTREEALRYFGLPSTEEGYQQLEDLVAEYDIGVSLDEYDRIIEVDPTELKEVLFEEHKKKTGHRPDSPTEMAREKEKKEKKDKEEKDKMEKDKNKLKMKVQAKRLEEH
jgi:hypothetical protein